MKKFFLLLAVVSFTYVSYAQEDDFTISGEKHSVSTNSFWANWFVQGNVTWNAFYDAGQTPLVAPFRKFPTGEGHTGLGFSAAIGKWFTPGLGLRAKFAGWRQGSKDANGNKPEKLWSGNGQVLFNVTNMLLGYDENRLWNAIPYAGAGFYRQNGCYRTMLSIGLLNTFRLTDRVAANLELGWGSCDRQNGGMALKNRLNQCTIEVGLTYKLGKHSWKPTPDMEAYQSLMQGELDALNAQLADMQNENAALQDEVKKANEKVTYSKPTVSTRVVTQETAKVVSAPISIFFAKGKVASAEPRDIENIAAIAKTARENNLKVYITGYADSKTGTAEANQKISERRAEAVAAELVKQGVSRDMITTVGGGGVDQMKNSDFNRRAVVELRDN
jgi:outer membrane protein OmpA-like peptidoglycan-associated protein